MTSSNLSIVFAPNLVRAPQESLQQAVLHSPIINSIMRTIIESNDNPKVIQALQTNNDDHSDG